MDTAWTRLGTLALEGLGGLPYFKGEGVLAWQLQVQDPPAAATQNVLAFPPAS